MPSCTRRRFWAPIKAATSPSCGPPQLRSDGMNHRWHAAGSFRLLFVALPFVARRFVTLPLAAGGAVLMAALLASASAQADKVADIAVHQGPDREQRLIEGGKREGVLTLYSN